jgi:hypothetical protein
LSDIRNLIRVYHRGGRRAGARNGEDMFLALFIGENVCGCSRVRSVQNDCTVVCDTGADSLQPSRCSRVAVRTCGAGFSAARASGVRRVLVVTAFRMHLRPAFRRMLCDLCEPAILPRRKSSVLLIASCCSRSSRQYSGLVHESVENPLTTHQSSATFLHFPQIMSFRPVAPDM